MDIERVDHGARRRALMRAAVGRPGSLRRWLIGSMVFLFLCALLFLYSGFLGRIVIFIFAAIVVMTTFRARSLATGNEDELRAWVRRATSRAARMSEQDEVEPLPEPEPRPLDDFGFHDAPPPPILEEGLHVDAGYTDDSRGSDQPVAFD